MAIERAPGGSVGNQADIKRYRPPKDQVARYYITKPGRQETLETVARATNITVKELLAFNFPGTVVRGIIVPSVVNWYLHHHVEFNCPETRDGRNRVFQGNERLAIPLRTTYIEFTEPRIIVGRAPKQSDLWLGVGEAHSGDLVAFGYFNWNAKLYRLGANNEGEIEWVYLMSHGFKLGGGLGGSGGLVAVFAHGVESASQFGSAFAWGDMDFDLALGGELGSALKGLKGVGKVVTTMEKYKKLSYTGKELLKNKAFIKKGVYTIPIPFAGAGIHIWIGRKYATTTCAGSGTGL